MNLQYFKPARTWTEALPLGNGRIGAMVHGGIDEECVSLNEDSLWSGYPRDWNNPQAKQALAAVREAVRLERYEEAERLSKAHMMGPYTQSYMPLGHFRLQFFHGQFVDHYKRELNLETACASVSYDIGDVHYVREVFVSNPDQVLVYRLTSSVPQKLNVKAWLDSKLRSSTMWTESYYAMKGYCPAEVSPNYVHDSDPIKYEAEGSHKTISFEGRLYCRVDSGATMRIDHDGIYIEQGTEIEFYFDAGTSFAGFDRMPDAAQYPPGGGAEQRLQLAMNYSYDQLLQRHMADYQHLYKRVQFQLGPNDHAAITERLSTEERLKRYGADDKELITLFFQYGRYLMIASSRAGTQPANLQGIWNADLRPIWSCNYTLNINLQMNYWLAEVANLSECHEPLLQFITDLSVTGERTATINYGCRGWTAHHNSDLWRQSAPPGNYGDGNPLWANWPMGGIWLCAHLWEHYLFTGNEQFLNDKAYPVMRKAALFCLDWLIMNEQQEYITNPSTSPEHRFRLADDQTPALTVASTMDISLIRELLQRCLDAIQILHLKEPLQEQFEQVVQQLPKTKIGARDQIQEWYYDFADEDAEHRHVSHLYDLYPGSLWNEAEYAPYMEAAKQTLKQRGDGGTGWSLSWKIALWARLLDGDHAYKLLRRLLVLVEDDGVMDFHRGGVYSNLFDAHPPFQIDGNFGAAAAIAEMLLQSHQDVIELLPALPTAWPEGHITGIKARGNVTVDMYWQEARLTRAIIYTTHSQTVKLSYKLPFHVSCGTTGKQLTLKPDMMQTLSAQAGQMLLLEPVNL